MNTIEASKNKWAYIYESLGLPPITGGTHFKGPCPLCSKTHHYRCDDRSGDGDWICSCNNGKGIALIQEVYQIDFNEACEIVDKIIGNNNKVLTVPSIHETKAEIFEKAFQNYSTINGTQAQKYLKNRGINILPDSESLRYCSKFEYDHVKMIHFPCVISKVLSNRGNLAYQHMTFLFNDQKIKLEPQRKIMSITTEPKGAAIRLFKYEDVLGVAEGIETAMSATQIYDVPTWSTLNTSLMKKFVCPMGVKKLIIFSDNDANCSGQAAAYECARRNMLIKNDLESISILWPEAVGDFNDMLMNNDYRIINHKYNKL